MAVSDRLARYDTTTTTPSHHLCALSLSRHLCVHLRSKHVRVVTGRGVRLSWVPRVMQARAAQGYRGGMGEIFRNVASINRIQPLTTTTAKTKPTTTTTPTTTTRKCTTFRS